MSAITWDASGERRYELGVTHGVLYVMKDDGTYDTGVAWNGLTGVTESPEGADLNDLWADNMKYGSIRATETFGATIEAYTYPDEFAACDGSVEVTDGVLIGQQSRSYFGFTYRTAIGDDQTSDIDKKYKIHIIYNATCSPSERSYETVNDSPDAMTFSWDVSTTAVSVTGYKPTSCITIDSTKVDATKLAALEKKLYGDTSSEPTLPTPDEVISMMKTT